MRIPAFVVALAFVVAGWLPTGAVAQNQLQLGKAFSVGMRQVNEHWLKIDYEPRDARRGSPGNDLPPGLERDVGSVGSGVSPVSDPGEGMRVGTRKVGDFQFDVKQEGSKTTGGLPPGLDRDVDPTTARSHVGEDPLGADRGWRQRVEVTQRPAAMRSAVERAMPAAGRAEPRSPTGLGRVNDYRPNRLQ